MEIAANVNTNQSVGPAWLNDLLVKDDTGKLHPYHQAREVMVTKDKAAEAGETDLQLAEQILPSIYLSPKDDNFVFGPLVGKPKEYSSHIFHPDDEEHLALLASQVPVDDSKKYSLEKIVARILEKQQLNFNQDSRDIFANILYDFFRNRKNSVLTREYLAKFNYAGKSLDSQVVDVIMSVIKTIKTNIDAIGGLVVKSSDIVVKKSEPSKITKSEVTVPTADIKTDFSPIFAPVSSSVKPEAPKPVVEEKTVASAPVKPKPIVPTAPQKTEVVTPIPVLTNRGDLPKVVRPIATPSKPRIADVQAKPQPAQSKPQPEHVLIGPVDELATMTLANWRRLGKTAADRAQKIYEKIAVLEKDSVSKKAAGIGGWRQSPVYRQYLDLGAASLSQNKEIAKIAQEKLAQGQESLDEEEFNIIGDLNKLLRF